MNMEGRKSQLNNIMLEKSFEEREEVKGGEYIGVDGLRIETEERFEGRQSTSPHKQTQGMQKTSHRRT